MKAIILAAGFGTRLLPHTRKTPKPLFPILGRPLLDILIQRLCDAGCRAVVINTHHLAAAIEGFVKEQDYPLPVHTRFEPTLLGTGGAIKNVEDFWDDDPLMVLNGDILTDIDLKAVYHFHLDHTAPVTLVLHDHARFNQVSVDSKDRIRGFAPGSSCNPPEGRDDDRILAFTGIHVLDPQVLARIPKNIPLSIIDLYTDMVRSSINLKAFIAENHFWYDIGTAQGYEEACREALARSVLERDFPAYHQESLSWSTLRGDGSERKWYRVCAGEVSLVLVAHGLHLGDDQCEADSFFAIGRHLEKRGIPVPHIYAYDRPSGGVAMNDLGGLHLQTLVLGARSQEEIVALYRRVIDILVLMQTEGAKGFDPAFCYESPWYNEDLILEREGRYFVEAFLQGYLGLNTSFADLKEGCEHLAESALDPDYVGFLHRDFQSRNILVREDQYFVIDFQGGRLGPLAYDLASLLIDPYVELPEATQERLLEDYQQKLSQVRPLDPARFLRSYRHCAVNRNLQILGAFAFLSKEKGKQEFEAYIPPAVRSLKENIRTIAPGSCRLLRQIVEGL
jgi:aminoglycoside/choline kinase family phosphotransferase